MFLPNGFSKMPINVSSINTKILLENEGRIKCRP
nr:MAG TPA: hypothetical protein [Caudoviricetes sp.]